MKTQQTVSGDNSGMLKADAVTGFLRFTAAIRIAPSRIPKQSACCAPANSAPARNRRIACWVTFLFGLLPGAAHAYDKIIGVVPGDTTFALGAWYVSSCSAVIGVGSLSLVSSNPPPSPPLYGSVTFGQVNGVPPSCPAGGPSLPAAASYYKWTSETPGVSWDSFALNFTYQGRVLEVFTIGVVNIAAQDGKKLGDCSCKYGLPHSSSSPAAGDPIDIASGNVVYSVTDYKTAGQNPLDFTRYYNSRGNLATLSLAARLGLNWRSTYDRYLNVVSPTSVVMERPDGQQFSFTLSGGKWTSDTDVDVTLTQSGSTWTLTDVDDSEETYAAGLPVAGYITTNYAHLTSIKSRNGYTRTLNYDGVNQLASVTDSYNRQLNFTYSNGALQTVTTPNGLTITYGYDTSLAVRGGAGGPILDNVINLVGIEGGYRLTSASYSTAPQTTQTYLYENAVAPFAMTGITDENGARYATWTYDQYARGLTSQLGVGAGLTTITYTDANESRTVTSALGVQDQYTFNSFANTLKLTGIHRSATATTAAATQTFTYDANGYVASQTDWNGNETTYTNNGHGLPTTVVEAAGAAVTRTTTIAYDSSWVHLPDTIATTGLTAAFTYDASGEQLTATLTDTTTGTSPYTTKGQKRTRTYSYANALVESITTPNGNKTTFGYDAYGALTSGTDALGHITSITAHTGGGLPETIVDPNGVKTTLAYDARQRLLSSAVNTAAKVLTTNLIYDLAGNLTSKVLPDGSTLTDSYDTAHRLTGITDLFKQSINYTLDALGDRTQSKIANAADAVQLQHAGTFDALGRVIQDIGGVGQTTKVTYDTNGNALTAMDPLGRVTTRTFDALNRLSTVTDPAAGVTSVADDTHDRPVSVADPNGNATKYTYDGFGDLMEQLSPDTGKTVFRYDADGNRVQSVDARGVVANYSFDALDRLTSITYPRAGAEDSVYSYDEAGHGFGIGRLTSVRDAAGTLSRTYDERGNLLNETRTLGAAPRLPRRSGPPKPAPARPTLTVGYSYDAANRIASISYPSGATVAYARDAMGRVTGLTSRFPGAAVTPVASAIAYEPFGPQSALTSGNGINETRSFDLDYRLTSLAAVGTSPVQKLTYGYNTANDLTTIADGVTAANSQNFGYDALDRLTSATGSYGTFGWTYDKLGNRLNQTRASATTTYGYTAGTNRLASIAAGGVTTPVAYTAAGNISSIPPMTGAPVATLTYNAANRLASVTGTPVAITGITYDAFGQRFSKNSGGTTNYFTYAQDGSLLEENDAGFPIDYVYLNGRPVAEILPSTGKVYFLHGDRLGTPQLATDGGQNVVWGANYQPFGETSLVTGSITQNLRFPGQYADAETGWNQNGWRDYMPQLGRYLEADPIGLGGGMNSYSYDGANPVNFTDPSGLCDEGDHDCIDPSYPEALIIGGILRGTVKTAFNIVRLCLGSAKSPQHTPSVPAPSPNPTPTPVAQSTPPPDLPALPRFPVEPVNESPTRPNDTPNNTEDDPYQVDKGPKRPGESGWSCDRMPLVSANLRANLCFLK